MAYNYRGQRVGRPHVAVWAEVISVPAADLISGQEDPAVERCGAAARGPPLPFPPGARAGQVRVRADAGHFAADLALAAHALGVGFAIGAKRMAKLWRLLGIATNA